MYFGYSKQKYSIQSPYLYLDTMDNWDEKKLEEVVNKKHGEAEKKKPKTQIVCSFLELSCFGIYHQGEKTHSCLPLTNNLEQVGVTQKTCSFLSII